MVWKILALGPWNRCNFSLVWSWVKNAKFQILRDILTHLDTLMIHFRKHIMPCQSPRPHASVWWSESWPFGFQRIWGLSQMGDFYSKIYCEVIGRWNSWIMGFVAVPNFQSTQISSDMTNKNALQTSTKDFESTWKSLIFCFPHW